MPYGWTICAVTVEGAENFFTHLGYHPPQDTHDGRRVESPSSCRRSTESVRSL